MRILKVKSVRKIEYDGERYDISIENNSNFFANGVLVHNSNFSACAYRDGELKVNQRNYSIRPKEGQEHSFWKTAEKQNLFKMAEDIRAIYDADFCALYGEFLGPGIQKNIYGLKEHKILVFDIVVFLENKKIFLSWDLFSKHVSDMGIPCVPILEVGKLREILGGKTIQEYSNGKSNLSGTPREGIVIKPVEESYCETLGGRLILKQRSPVYLAKTDN